MFYAQLNENAVVIGITQTSKEIKSANMIEISNYDTDLLGRKYENGEYSEIKYDPETSVPADELEELKQENQELRELLADLTELVLMGGMGDE